MSKPKITLEQILKTVRARPPNPELDLATVDFMDLPESEQRAILFRELCYQGGQINWIMAQFGVGPLAK